MKKKSNEFITSDSPHYRFQLGKITASALSGFIAGVIFASIVWVLFFIYYKVLVVSL